MERSEDALDDVSDIGVVAAGGAIAEDRDRLTRFDQADEFVDREVGTLTRTINGKEAKAQESDAIQVTIHMAE